MITVSAGLPGADPATVAATVAAPLERRLGQISGVSEITSVSTLGGTAISIQFSLDRNVDGAARDVQAAINAAAGDLPFNLPAPPTYRKVNPAALASAGLSMEDVRGMLGQVNVDEPKGSLDGHGFSYTINSNDQLLRVEDYESLILTQKLSGPIKLNAVGHVISSVENTRQAGWAGTNAAVVVIIFKQADANVIE